jgi:hypothetical protein
MENSIWPGSTFRWDKRRDHQLGIVIALPLGVLIGALATKLIVHKGQPLYSQSNKKVQRVKVE